MTNSHLFYEHPNNIYRNLPHKRMEFWHRNTFIFGFDIESAEVSMHKKDESLYSHGYYKPKGVKSYYSIEGGQICLKMKPHESNLHLFNVIKGNISNARRHMICIDGVLRNKITNNYLQLNLLSGSHEVFNQDFDILKIHFAAITI